MKRINNFLMKISLFIVLFLSTISLFSQQNSKIVNVINIIQDVYNSDSSKFIFNLDSLPAELIPRIVYLDDSITNLKKTKYLFSTNKSNEFIANRNEEYNATDNSIHVLPKRKFIFGMKKDNRLFFYYWHGGRGNHLHLIYYDMNNKNSLTSFSTLRNWGIIGKLDNKNKLYKIKKHKLLTPLISVSDLRMLNCNIIEDIIDIF